MLSFFRKKSTDNNDMQTNKSNLQQIPISEDALLKQLGYTSAKELQETIYGKIANN